jgi:hypothetical protein
MLADYFRKNSIKYACRSSDWANGY